LYHVVYNSRRNATPQMLHYKSNAYYRN